MGVGLPETMWTALCVGLGVAAMVLLANVPMFASIPAQVYGFASTVAYAMMKGGSVTEASMANPVVVIILSMILGAVFGYVSEKVAGMLAGPRRPSGCGKGLTRRERDARANTLRERDRWKRPRLRLCFAITA